MAVPLPLLVWVWDFPAWNNVLILEYYSSSIEASVGPLLNFDGWDAISSFDSNQEKGQN